MDTQFFLFSKEQYTSFKRLSDLYAAEVGKDHRTEDLSSGAFMACSINTLA